MRANPVVRGFPVREEGQVELLGRRLNILARTDLAAPWGRCQYYFLRETQKPLDRKLPGFRRYSRIADCLDNFSDCQRPVAVRSCSFGAAHRPAAFVMSEPRSASAARQEQVWGAGPGGEGGNIRRAEGSRRVATI